jgi:hypothetical protein
MKADELKKEFEEIIGYTTGAVLTCVQWSESDNGKSIVCERTPDLDTAKLLKFIKRKIKEARIDENKKAIETTQKRIDDNWLPELQDYYGTELLIKLQEDFEDRIKELKNGQT